MNLFEKLKNEIKNEIEAKNEKIKKYNEAQFLILNRVVVYGFLSILFTIIFIVSTPFIKSNIMFKIRDFFFYNNNYTPKQKESDIIKNQLKDMLDGIIIKKFNGFEYKELYNDIINKAFETKHFQTVKLFNKVFTSPYLENYEIEMIKKINGVFTAPPETDKKLIINLDNTYVAYILTTFQSVGRDNPFVTSDNNINKKLYQITFHLNDKYNFYKNIQIDDMRELNHYKDLMIITRLIENISKSEFFSIISNIAPNIVIGYTPNDIKIIKVKNQNDIYYILFRLGKKYYRLYVFLSKKNTISFSNIEFIQEGE
jgi:hypothetical protein